MVFRADLTVSTSSFEHKTPRLLEFWITSNFLNPRFLSFLSPRLAIPAPSLLPLPQESNHGDLKASEYFEISIQQTGLIKFLLWPQAPTPRSYLSQPNSVNSSQKKRNCEMWCLVMVEISYSTRSAMSRSLSAAIVHCHTSCMTEIYSLVSILRSLSNSQGGQKFPPSTSSSYCRVLLITSAAFKSKKNQ